MNRNILEVCAASIESILAARQGGASRIELCSALEIGGVTPSAGLIKEARKVEGLALHVLIRPRGGDFLYNAHEVACMEQDIYQAKECGADGVVIGALTADGEIDVAVCSRLMKAAQGMNVTFHRAFDRCCNPQEALENIVRLGCNRILTSGQAATAEAGIPLLRQLVNQADGRLLILPGCGVNRSNAEKILRETGTTEIHASAGKSFASLMKYHNKNVSMGSSDADELRRETDADEVRHIVEAITFLPAGE
ncbi:MAG: copper homeostasis protein CutC [Bacteroides sp.]|nr:copper homeostasis protein CutC [Bacteroides sp.]